MILVYILFALTVSTVLTALLSGRFPQSRAGEVFIGFFVALMLLAGAADEWLFPALAAGEKATWLPILLLIMFGGILAASAILSVKMPGPPQEAVADHGQRVAAEAMTFDVVLWLALLTVGIAVLRSTGF